MKSQPGRPAAEGAAASARPAGRPGRWSAAHLLSSQVIYVGILQAAGLAGLVYALVIDRPDPAWWLVSLGCYFVSSCLGIALTYHRSLAHGAVRLPKPLEYLFAWFGAVGGSGSAIGWVAMHRQHHAHADSPGDPHAPGRFGIGVLGSIYRFSFARNVWRVRELLGDPFHLFVHRYYALLILAWAIALAAIDLNALLYTFLIPAALQITALNLLNTLTHRWGYRSFDTKDNSRNNWPIALLTWGEGWHNNHHHRPQSWTLRRRWWEFDIVALVIWCLGPVAVCHPCETAPSENPAAHRPHP